MDPPSLSLPEEIPAIRIQISCNDQISLATRDEMNTAVTIRTTTIE